MNLSGTWSNQLKRTESSFANKKLFETTISDLQVEGRFNACGEVECVVKQAAGNEIMVHCKGCDKTFYTSPDSGVELCPQCNKAPAKEGANESVSPDQVIEMFRVAPNDAKAQAMQMIHRWMGMDQQTPSAEIIDFEGSASESLVESGIELIQGLSENDLSALEQFLAPTVESLSNRTAGLSTMVRNLRKRLKSLDVEKADASEIRDVSQALDALETRLEKEIEMKKKKKEEKAKSQPAAPTSTEDPKIHWQQTPEIPEEEKHQAPAMPAEEKKPLPEGLKLIDEPDEVKEKAAEVAPATADMSKCAKCNKMADQCICIEMPNALAKKQSDLVCKECGLPIDDCLCDLPVRELQHSAMQTFHVEAFLDALYIEDTNSFVTIDDKSLTWDQVADKCIEAFLKAAAPYKCTKCGKQFDAAQEGPSISQSCPDCKSSGSKMTDDEYAKGKKATLQNRLSVDNALRDSLF